MPRDWSLRSVITGMLIGALLSVCNIYAGLKIGFSANMSITGSLLAYAVWQVRPRRAREASPFTILETNLSQAACSSAAAVSSAGLVAGIPALTILTGIELPWWKLSLWLFSVCIVGVVIAVPVRRQMLIADGVPFPYGIAAAETLQQMYAKGSEAIARVRALLIAGAISGAFKPLEHFKKVPSYSLPFALKGVALKNLTWSLDPSLILVAVGGLSGVRAGVSLLGGAVIAYGVIAPRLIASGLIKAGDPAKPWFKELTPWLLWPGVTLMVVSSLVSLALSWRSVLNTFRGLSGGGSSDDPDDVPPRWFGGAFAITLCLSTGLQVAFFGIPWWVAVIAVMLSFVLGVVGARVGGETGLVPVGAMGKVMQLVAGVILPGNVAANLMTANVTGGSASQCSDLMNDFKTGTILGSTPRSQWVSQLAGALIGSLFGAAVYLVLIPDPEKQLLTTEFAAPAVATWKAVAEVFKVGLSAVPRGAPFAIGFAAVIAVVLAVIESKVDKATRAYVPSAAALGLAFVVPANQSLSLFIGGLLGWFISKRAPEWHARFWIVVCAGVIAGESLVGVGLSLWQVLTG